MKKKSFIILLIGLVICLGLGTVYISDKLSKDTTAPEDAEAYVTNCLTDLRTDCGENYGGAGCFNRHPSWGSCNSGICDSNVNSNPSSTAYCSNIASIYRLVSDTCPNCQNNVCPTIRNWATINYCRPGAGPMAPISGNIILYSTPERTEGGMSVTISANGVTKSFGPVSNYDTGIFVQAGQSISIINNTYSSSLGWMHDIYWASTISANGQVFVSGQGWADSSTGSNYDTYDFNDGHVALAIRGAPLTPTSTPTNTPTLTPDELADTITPTPTSTNNPTLTPTELADTITPTPTATNAPTISPSISISPSTTVTPSATPSISPSGIPSGTPSITPNITTTITPSNPTTSTLPPTAIITDEVDRIIIGISFIFFGLFLYRSGTYLIIGNVFWSLGGKDIWQISTKKGNKIYEIIRKLLNSFVIMFNIFINNILNIWDGLVIFIFSLIQKVVRGFGNSLKRIVKVINVLVTKSVLKIINLLNTVFGSIGLKEKEKFENKLLKNKRDE
jgi:hypothetical protein